MFDINIYKTYNILNQRQISDKMRGHLICFGKLSHSAYFSHNGGKTTMSQKGKADFFENLGPQLIRFKVKSSIQKSAYEPAVSPYSTREINNRGSDAQFCINFHEYNMIFTNDEKVKILWM